jgi:hypothetical protein
MNDLIEAFYYTWPLWAFLAVLSASLFVEEGIKAYSKRKMVDNPAIW